jgi:hypothetical protein
MILLLCPCLAKLPSARLRSPRRSTSVGYRTARTNALRGRTPFYEHINIYKRTRGLFWAFSTNQKRNLSLHAQIIWIIRKKKVLPVPDESKWWRFLSRLLCLFLISFMKDKCFTHIIISHLTTPIQYVCLYMLYSHAVWVRVTGFWIIGFIDHLQVSSTSNCNTIAISTLYISLEHTV